MYFIGKMFSAINYIENTAKNNAVNVENKQQNRQYQNTENELQYFFKEMLRMYQNIMVFRSR